MFYSCNQKRFPNSRPFPYSPCRMFDGEGKEIARPMVALDTGLGYAYLVVFNKDGTVAEHGGLMLLEVVQYPAPITCFHESAKIISPEYIAFRKVMPGRMASPCDEQLYRDLIMPGAIVAGIKTPDLLQPIPGFVHTQASCQAEARMNQMKITNRPRQTHKNRPILPRR